MNTYEARSWRASDSSLEDSRKREETRGERCRVNFARKEIAGSAHGTASNSQTSLRDITPSSTRRASSAVNCFLPMMPFRFYAPRFLESVALRPLLQVAGAKDDGRVTTSSLTSRRVIYHENVVAAAAAVVGSGRRKKHYRCVARCFPCPRRRPSRHRRALVEAVAYTGGEARPTRRARKQERASGFCGDGTAGLDEVQRRANDVPDFADRLSLSHRELGRSCRPERKLSPVARANGIPATPDASVCCSDDDAVITYASPTYRPP